MKLCLHKIRRLVRRKAVKAKPHLGRLEKRNLARAVERVMATVPRLSMDRATEIVQRLRRYVRPAISDVMSMDEYVLEGPGGYGRRLSAIVIAYRASPSRLKKVAYQCGK